MNILPARAQQNLGIIGSVDTPGMAEGVWIAGDRAYVADGTHGIQVIDISDPQSPHIIDTLTTDSPASFASKVWIEGNYAYIADGPSYDWIDVREVKKIVDDKQLIEQIEVEMTTHGFQVIDHSSGQVYKFEDETEDWPIMPDHATDIAIVAGFAYVADQEAGVHIFNVENLSQGWYVKMLDIPGTAEAIVVKDKLAFVAAGDAGLQIIGVIKPLRPVIIGSVDTPGHAEGLAIKDNLAFVGDGPGGASRS